MARYTGPKNKLSRREGIDLFNKGMKLRRLNIPPGVHGPKSGRRKSSEYNNQLREKQKVRRFYGVLEKQFRKYYHQASLMPGQTGSNLLQLLETRLDNVLVRAGICPTRAMARQLVVHGHVMVNNKKVTRPSYATTVDEVITLSKKAQAMPAINKEIEKTDNTISPWLKRKAMIIKIDTIPIREHITEEFNEQSIIEYYSR